MNYLVYLHSLGLTHKVLHKIFKTDSNHSDYKEFFLNLSFDRLKKFIDNDNQIQKILESKSKLDTKIIDKKLQNL
jgi:hypothetical protein